MTKVLLYKSAKGVEFVRTDCGNSSKVDVSVKGMPLARYVFRNVAQYEHPMLSWENLDKCNGWVHDEKDIIRLVLEKKKPAGEATVYGTEENIDLVRMFNLPSESSEIEYKHSASGCTAYIRMASSGYNNLAEIFDIEEICAHYKKLGLDVTVSCDVGAISSMMQEPLLDMLVKSNNRFSYDYADPLDKNQLIVTGLLLGYPLESTVSIMRLW